MIAGLASLAGFAAGGTAGSFGADVSDEVVQKTGSTPGGAKTLTTSNVTVTPHGGTSPYTYSWVRTSGSALITATAASSAVTAFTATLNANQEAIAEFTCTVTDASLATTQVLVQVSLELVGYA